MLRHQSRYAEAEVLYRRALTRAEGWLGPNHTSTLKVASLLGLLLAERGEEEASEEARRLFERALVGLEQAGGQMHPDTLSIVANLANLYQMTSPGAAQNFRDAKPTLEKIVQATAADDFDASVLNLGGQQP